MCGIVGYLGTRNAADVIVDGLRSLEYRGYDSAGLAVKSGDEIFLRKRSGKIGEIESELLNALPYSTMGIGHTRWATHGAATDENAHPHMTRNSEVAVVHNGIIENYVFLRNTLGAEGVKFNSQTDSEVIAYLVEKYYQKDLFSAVKIALREVIGTYALVVMHRDHDELVVASNISPIVIGVKNEETIIASDVTAVLPHTRKVIYLNDNEFAIVKNGKIELIDKQGKSFDRKPVVIDWSMDQVKKNGFAHYMIKEIHEQPGVFRNIIESAFNNNSHIADLVSKLDVSKVKRIHIPACGSAYHVGLLAKQIIETMIRIPVEVDIASEYRYKDVIADSGTLVIAISQSGETIDTIEALKSAKKKNAKTLAVVNVINSSLARVVDYVAYIQAGPEIGVASTKAYTATLLTLILLSLEMAEILSTISGKEIQVIRECIKKLPFQAEELLSQQNKYIDVAKKYVRVNHFFFLGRKLHAPSAMEGALKLKEISYIHAEAYTAGELKHGPIALIETGFPVFIIALSDKLYEKNILTVQEILSRGGQLLGIATRGDTQLADLVGDVFYVPPTHEYLTPLIVAIPLQLFAYYMACLLDREVDQPRNLAKSVTVE